MTIDFYYDPRSPPCRTVQLLATILNVPLNPILTIPGQGDTQTPEFKRVSILCICISLKDMGGCECTWDMRVYSGHRHSSDNDVYLGAVYR